MKLRNIRHKCLIALTITSAVPMLAACGSKNSSSNAETSAEVQQDKPKGKVGGPQLGTPGGGPVIDKSSDATLQSMIKELVPKFQVLEYKDAKTGITMKYNLFVPQNMDNSKKYPLVMFTADASTPGEDVTRPLTQGYGGLIWATDQWQSEHPCYVLVPQYSGVAVNDAYEHTDEVDVAVRMLMDIVASRNVDSSRLYTTGQSMGGMISMYYNVTYPDVFAASIFVDCHWETSTFEELAKHKFVYFIAGDKGKAYTDIKPLEAAAEKDSVGYTFAAWSAKLPEARQSELAAVMLDKGDPINIFQFEPGTVLPEDGKGSEHMYSFDYAYKIASVREWMFNQHK